MRDCDEFRPMVTALLDKELSGDDAARVEEHFLSCVACANALADITALKSAAAQDPLLPATDMWARIHDHISDLPESAIVAEIRLLRQEMKALREEVSGLRHELAQRPTPQLSRSLVLNLPDAPMRARNQYRLV